MTPTVNANVTFGARTPLCEDESPQGLLCMALPILSHMWLSEGFEVIAALDKFYWAGSNSKLSHWRGACFHSVLVLHRLLCFHSLSHWSTTIDSGYQVPELSCLVWLAVRIRCLSAPVSKGNCMTQQGSNIIQL